MERFVEGVVRETVGVVEISKTSKEARRIFGFKVSLPRDHAHFPRKFVETSAGESKQTITTATVIGFCDDSPLRMKSFSSSAISMCFPYPFRI